MRCLKSAFLLPWPYVEVLANRLLVVADYQESYILPLTRLLPPLRQISSVTDLPRSLATRRPGSCLHLARSR
jgi:hypothetical protein